MNNIVEKTYLPFICLNMIIKNESSVIIRLLKSVINQIDVVIISDTGSTDNTKVIIQEYMKKVNKSLYWIEDIEFKDFGYNRTYALKECIKLLNKYYKTDVQNLSYIIFIDADMIFEQNGEKTLKEYLNENKYNSYNIFQGTDYYYYYNTRIISNNIWNDSEYIGVTHEYLSIPEPSYNILKNDFFIKDIGDGGSKKDKYERDIKLLKDGLIKQPNNERYIFYLANSYFDANHNIEAIEMYKKRIECQGWFEEVWYSYYRIGYCYMRLNESDNAIIYWFKAFEYSDYRIENLYEIVKFYCRNKHYKLAYHIYLMTDNILKIRPQKEDILFFCKDVYEYLLKFEFTICTYYYNPLNIEIIDYYMKLLNNPIIDDITKKSLYSNLKFDAIELSKIQCINTPLINLFNKILEESLFIVNNEFKSDEKMKYYNSTPTIVFDDYQNKLYMNIRFVNYKIDKNTGEYLRESYIGTKNLYIIVKLMNIDSYTDSSYILSSDKSSLFYYERIEWLPYNTKLDNYNENGYVGLEDIRLSLIYKIVNTYNHDPFDGDFYEVSNYDYIVYNCNRGIGNTGNITVEIGLISGCGSIMTHGVQFLYDVDKNKEIDNIVEISNNIEKNWVCFFNKEKKCRIIYKWGDPLTICKIKDGKLIKTNTIKSPPFFKDLRGSSNGIKIDNEIWFICHLVSYEERRYYYHCFVVLDFETFEILRFSKLWTFEKSPVEYCLSFIYDMKKSSNSFIIGYSVLDCTTKFIEISMENIKKLF